MSDDLRTSMERAVTSALLQLPLPDVGTSGGYRDWPIGPTIVRKAIKQPDRRWRRCSYCFVKRATSGEEFCRDCLAMGRALFPLR